MPIECQFYGPLREAVGTKSLSRDVPDDGTVGGVLDALTGDYPALASELYDEDGGLRDRLIVSCGGRNVKQLDGLATPVADGDRLRLSPPVEGGAASPAEPAPRSDPGPGERRSSRRGDPGVDGVGQPARTNSDSVIRSSGTTPSGVQPRRS